MPTDSKCLDTSKHTGYPCGTHRLQNCAATIPRLLGSLWRWSVRPRASQSPKRMKTTFCPYYIVVLQPHECISQCNACRKANKKKPPLQYQETSEQLLCFAWKQYQSFMLGDCRIFHSSIFWQYMQQFKTMQKLNSTHHTIKLPIIVLSSSVA
jgi:hypothetical protein